MLRRRGTKTQGAQSFLEYTMVVSAIVMVLFAMSPMIKRGIQGMIKVVADEVGFQQNAEQQFDESGHLELANTQARSYGDKTRIETPAGPMGYLYNDRIAVDSEMVSNLGFREED